MSDSVIRFTGREELKLGDLKYSFYYKTYISCEFAREIGDASWERSV